MGGWVGGWEGDLPKDAKGGGHIGKAIELKDSPSFSSSSSSSSSVSYQIIHIPSYGVEETRVEGRVDGGTAARAGVVQAADELGEVGGWVGG